MGELIPQETIDEIVHRLVEGLQPERIILFGSYAYGEAMRDSDLDLMVIVAESDEPPVRRDQRAHACLSGVGVPVDVLVYTRDEMARGVTVRTSLARTVVDRGRVLHERREARGDRELARQVAA
ncbi:MAG: nucleotidyltransferase domain-containing protein [Armatimonadetes bacterium]|nr:nucleotidyltransferase domain-containing protein [Armatimonadota bacterium]